MFNLQTINLRNVRLESENLVLNEIPFSDRYRFFELFSDIEMLRFTDKKPTLTADEAIIYLKECHEKSNLKSHIYLGIYNKPDLNLTGIVSLYHIDTKHKFGSLGILLDKKCWRKGIMTEALTTFMHFCFSEIGFHRIEAQTFVNNIPAVNFFEKLKFTKEGRLRENFLIEGKYEDSFLFSMLNSEFIQTRDIKE